MTPIVLHPHTPITSSPLSMDHAPARWRLAMVCVGLCVLVGTLSGCATERALRTPDVTATVQADLRAAAGAPVAVPARVLDALAEPPAMAPVLPPEPRLDLLVNNAQAREVFLAMVADSRYSMLMHPDVKGTLSVTLRGVTVAEALEAIRDVYGYDFRIDGRRITVYAPTLQTRVFTVNYPNSQRSGTSGLRVSSGAQTSPSTGNSSSTSASGAGAGPSSSAGAAPQAESSSVSTQSKTDIWSELAASVRALVGTGEGRSVVVSPQAGIMAVRAMPDELRQVDKFLRAAQMSVERQVMLEAKIVAVELRDGYQSGINWAGFGSNGSTSIGAGVFGSSNLPGVPIGGATALPGTVSSPSFVDGGGLFGLALRTSQFAAVLGFLETQGDVQTLSNPRIATLNNQKAVLKVGSDEYFVTGVAGGSTTSATATTAASVTAPTVTLTPFFSGISLDVTPQIDEGNNVTLHVHPAVATVTEKSKTIDLGQIGTFRLPAASNSVNESDTMVRIQDGRIVAIGGLMQLESSRNASGLPGSAGVPLLSALFGNRANTGRKQEVVVLIKPTIIRSAQDWEAQTARARAALDEMETTRARVIRIDGTLAPKPLPLQ